MSGLTEEDCGFSGFEGLGHLIFLLSQGKGPVAV